MGSPSDAPPLVIRADADANIGAGHVVRCLALAEAWRNRSGTVLFLSCCSNEALRRRIESAGCSLTLLDARYPDSGDLYSTLKLLKAIAKNDGKAPWIVLDGYHFCTDYQHAIRSAGYKLMVIDDIAHLVRYDATVILNHAITASNLTYYCNPDAALLLGTRYGLLRSEFQRWRGLAHPMPPVATNILVTLGGSDAGNVTSKVVEALKEITVPDLKIRIVVGPVYPYLEELKHTVSRSSLNIRLETNVSEMAPLMAWADVAVAAAGTTSWELAFMGVPTLLLVLADNQQLVATGLAESGVARALGTANGFAPIEIAAELQSLMLDCSRRERMAQAGRNALDGKGADRVASFLLDMSCMRTA